MTCFGHAHIFFPCRNHNTAETHNQLCVLTDRKINSRPACKLCKGTFPPASQNPYLFAECQHVELLFFCHTGVWNPLESDLKGRIESQILISAFRCCQGDLEKSSLS